MTVDLESFTLTVDDPFFGSFWGMWEGSNDSGSMSPQDSGVVYPDAIFRGVMYSPSQDEFYLQLYGLHQNSGWDVIEVNGTNFSRSSATYSVGWVNDITRPSGSSPSTFKGPMTFWEWGSITTNPFPTTVGATVTVKFKHNGHVPATGSISLNQIHQEAGGSSGTQGSINDSDIRGKSWHAVVQGSTPASGATQDFLDFYWPRHLNDTTVLRRSPSTVNSVSSGQTYRAAYISQGDIVFIGGSGNVPLTTYTDVSFTIKQDGTDTYVYVAPLVGGTTTTRNIETGTAYTKYDGAGSSSSQTGKTTVFKVDGFAADQVALYSVVYTSVASGYDGSNETFTASTNRLPHINATNISNSSTSFTTMSTNVEYGRSFGAARYYSASAGPQGFLNSTVVCRYDVILRKLPSTGGCFLDKTVSFVIDLNIIDSLEGGG